VDRVEIPNLRVLDIWRIPNHDIESTLAHHAVELGKPVEGLVAFAPSGKCLGLVGVDAIVTGQIAIQFQTQRGELVAQLALVVRRDLATVDGLLFAEAVEEVGQIGSAGLDFVTVGLVASQRVGGVELDFGGVACRAAVPIRDRHLPATPA